MMTLGNMPLGNKQVSWKLRTLLLAIFLVPSLLSSQSIAQQDCATGTRVWYTDEMTCAALFTALANRVDMNVGQQDRARMFRARADYLLRLAQDHAREIGGDPKDIQSRYREMSSSSGSDSALKAAAEVLKDTCESTLKRDLQLDPAQLRSLMCNHR
jgi:hypothetical protein